MTNLAKDWFNAANPHSEMIARTADLSIPEIASLNNTSVVREVFPEVLEAGIVVNSKVAAKILYLVCALSKRSKSGVFGKFPINVGDTIYVPKVGTYLPNINGLNLLLALGIETEVEIEEGYSAIPEEKAEIEATKFGLKAECVSHSALCAVLAKKNPNVKFLTYGDCASFVESYFGDSLDNIVYVEHDWVRPFNFHVEMEDVLYVVQTLAEVLPGNSFSYTTKEKELILTLDGEFEFSINKDGVYENSRSRRFGNTLLVYKTAKSEELDILGKDLILLNSYGTFLYGLITLGAKYLCDPKLPLGQLHRLLTDGVSLPINSLKEIGYEDPDRVQYDKFVTIERQYTGSFPISLTKVWGPERTFKVCLAANEHTVLRGIGGFTKPLIDRSALLTFNLVRKGADYLVDGRSVCIQAKHIPENVRQKWVDKVIAENGGDPNTSAEDFIVALSSKVAKLTKRCLMADAVVGEIIGGETRGFRRFGQPEVSKNNFLVQACISLSHILPPGAAYLWGEDPTLKVKKVEIFEPHVDPYYGLEKAVTLEGAGEITKEGDWYSVSFDNVPIEGAYGYVLFKGAKEVGIWYLTSKTPDALLSKVEWRKSKTNGNQTGLKIRVTTYQEVTQIKGRNYQKAMVSRFHSSILHNGLNGNIVAESLFPRDTNKWLDGVQQVLDVAACTAIKNNDQEGKELIAKCNSYVGEECEELVWSPVLALLGIYEFLIGWFKEKYSNIVWTTISDESGEYSSVLQELYSEWFPQKSVDVNLPEGAEGVRILAQDKNPQDNTNILVFFNVKGVDYIYQRGECYVGTEETGPVWQPLKAELSSVRDSVGTTPMMGGVARALEGLDKSLGMQVTKDGFESMNLGASFNCMASGRTFSIGGKELGVVDMAKYPTALAKEKYVDVIADEQNQEKLLPSIVEANPDAFNNHLLQFTTEKGEVFNLHLPSICKKDANLNFRGGGLGDLVTSLLIQAISGNLESSEAKNLLPRVLGALRSVSKGASFLKSVAYGRVGVQCKPVSYPGIPVKYVYVKYSGTKDSVFQTMKRTFGGNPDGVKVATARAPMVEPTLQEVKVIYNNSDWFNILPEHSISVSPFATIKHGGDFDGDGNSLYKVETDLPLVTIQDLKNNLVVRTGSDQLNPGDSYWGDWYEIVHPDKIKGKIGVSNKNLSDCLGFDVSKESDRKSLPLMLKCSTKTFGGAVGWVHRLFLTGDIYISLVRELKDELKTLFPEWNAERFTEHEGIVSILAEVYEVPLAGLDWNAYDVFYDYLVPLIGGAKPLNLEEMKQFSLALSKAGMNGGAAQSIHSAAKVVSLCRASSSGEFGISLKSPEGLLIAATELSVLASKAQLDLTNSAHFDLYSKFLNWIEVHNAQGLVEKSAVLVALNEYSKTILDSQLGKEVDLDLSF